MVSILLEAQRFSLGGTSDVNAWRVGNPALEDIKVVEIHEGREIRSG